MNNENLLKRISQKEAAMLQEMLADYDAFDVSADQIRVVKEPTITKAGTRTEHDYLLSLNPKSCECYNYRKCHEGRHTGCKHLNFVWFILGYVLGDLIPLEKKSGIPIKPSG